MNPKAINYLSLARKAGRIEVGEEPVGAAARAGYARLILIASDAPDNTRRRAKNFAAGTEQQLAVLPFTKEEMGAALGRTVVALAAMTDPAMALAFLKALDDAERYGEAIALLTVKSERIRRHQQEEKAHQKNLRTGKFRRESQVKAPQPEEPAQKPAPAKQTFQPRGSSGGGKGHGADFHKNEDRRRESSFGRKKSCAGGRTAGQKGRLGRPAGQKPAGDFSRRNTGKKYPAGNKAAGHRFGKKTHGGAEV